MTVEPSSARVTPPPLLRHNTGINRTESKASIPITLSAEKPSRLPLWSPSFYDTADLDPRFRLPRCEVPDKSELIPVERFVATAIQEQHNVTDDNNSRPIHGYNAIVDALRSKKDLTMTTRLLIALRTADDGLVLNLLTTSSIKHARLIHQVIRFNPFDLPSEEGENAPLDLSLVDAHLHLVVAIVSSNSVFLVPVLSSIWKTLSLNSKIECDTRSQRLHAAIATITRLCPKGRTELSAIIASNAPYRTRPAEQLEFYYRQCLHILNYIPALQGHVLEMILDRCLEVDVEIKINDGGEALIDEDDDGIFEFDQDEEKQRKPKLGPDVTVDEMAEKLDNLMFLVLEYVENTVETDSMAVEKFYDIFVRVFESSILITHKSKFVQFVLFHLCGLESKALEAQTISAPDAEATLYRDYAAKLIEVILDPFRATVIRQSGACYLASFVSRSSYVCGETICESVCALLRWAEAYIKALEGSSVHASDSRNLCSLHALFYTVCQSAFYIMCFRGTDAMRYFHSVIDKMDASSPNFECIDIRSDRWTKLCTHQLQPLKYCLETVRTEFLHLSGIFRLVDASALDRLVDQEKQVVASKRKRVVSKIKTAATLEKERLNGGVGGLGHGTNPLDSFFPFDPYLLRRSHKFIEPFYRHWNGSIDEYEEDSETAEECTFCPQDDADLDRSDNDQDSDDDSESEIEDDLEVSDSKPMSLVSNVATPTKTTLQDAWSTALKRTRAPSIENGSW